MNAGHSARIAIADDHPLFRGALRQAVEAVVPGTEITESGNFESLLEVLAHADSVDLALLDLTLPDVQGFSGLLYLRAQYPEVPVVIVSANDDPVVIRRSIEFGASGFIPKSLDVPTMGAVFETILAGNTWIPPDIDLNQPTDQETGELVRRVASLTPQQVRVLMMLSQGLLNKQIAYELAVSEATVKAHVSAILQKLGVESRTQAVIAAARIATAAGPASAA
ncbi:DNA-binding NarL/FixJ family response regulator [Pseudochelatococcus contaminans]|uniref:DNA-binding NarL/FixJ family response regulator n=1 Tax=Pseudochelatococcus contaminans TaxID=1538103 RepID=A0A7W5Z7E0_9HYPH|nr:response regulator transcription factor [Pseudochelatococcus contaminans]MBB3811349.1 DNA-binding NarL/FixJ family response regulator [Pseudochelatococcus contaminans]